jgi:hypothetical protein
MLSSSVQEEVVSPVVPPVIPINGVGTGLGGTGNRGGSVICRGSRCPRVRLELSQIADGSGAVQLFWFHDAGPHLSGTETRFSASEYTQIWPASSHAGQGRGGFPAHRVFLDRQRLHLYFSQLVPWQTGALHTQPSSVWRRSDPRVAGGRDGLFPGPLGAIGSW